jgi:purine-binding chemotaxis protein CheW
MQETESYCTFLVRGSRCGVPVRQVREIVCDQALTPVPLAHEAVRGLINLRGQILTVVDVGRWMRLPNRGETDPSPARFHLIVDLGREMVSLCVEAMGPVIMPLPEQLEPIPAGVEPHAAEMIQAAARMPDETVMLLRLDRLRDMKGAIKRPSNFGRIGDDKTTGMAADSETSQRGAS